MTTNLLLGRVPMANVFTNMFSTVRTTIEDPWADPQQTIVVVGVITGVLLLLVLMTLVVYFIVSSVLNKDKRIVLPTRQLTRREKIISYGVIAALALGFYLSSISYMSKPETCAFCHTKKKQIESVNKSTHKNVACLSCHQRPGIIGGFTQKLDYIRWFILFPTADAVKHQAEVDDGACLSCHSKVQTEVVMRMGVRAKHKEIAEAGYRCVECHNGVAHGSTAKTARKATMEKCISCHNDKVASAECDSCHVPRGLKEGEGGGERLASREFLRIGLKPPSDCRGCHDVEQECTTCHGIEMPHPPDVKKNKHGAVAFTNKELCFRCHNGGYAKFCNRCHQFPSPHGAEKKWAAAHGAAAARGYSIGLPDVDVTVTGCQACHSSRLCSACHDDGRKAPTPKELDAQRKAKEKAEAAEAQVHTPFVPDPNEE
ncbi:MAG: cytochrome c3 family protein [Candidatus Aquicultorales bacterium]